MKRIADKLKNFAADNSYSAYIKKCVLWVTAISLSSGMFFGSFLDGMFLSRNEYPYRAPFEEIIWLAFLLASIILWIRYIIFIFKYPNDTKYQAADLLISLIGSLMLTVVFSFIWIFAIGMVHDIKIAVGLSNP